MCACVCPFVCVCGGFLVSLCLCVCVCVHLCVCVWRSSCEFVSMCVRVSICVCVWRSSCEFVPMCVHLCVCVWRSSRVCVSVSLCVRVSTHLLSSCPLRSTCAGGRPGSSSCGCGLWCTGWWRGTCSRCDLAQSERERESPEALTAPPTDVHPFIHPFTSSSTDSHRLTHTQTQTHTLTDSDSHRPSDSPRPETEGCPAMHAPLPGLGFTYYLEIVQAWTISNSI